MTGKLLLVTNRRPEDSGGRAEKISARKRLLKQYGWEVEVLHVPEPYLLGFPNAVRRGIALGRQRNIDVVASINNPFHLHLIGYLVSTVLQKPWIAELRDPISNHPDRKPSSPATWGAKFVERVVVHHADRVVWFDGIQLPENYFHQYDIPNDRVVKLPPMGYDREKFEAAEADEYETFTITYAGSFYEGWIEPYTFLEGVGEYVEQTGDRGICVQFFGDWNVSYESAAERAGIADLVENHEFVPHEEIIPVLKGSDVLLYIGGSNPGNRLNLPSKLWDYVGAGKPILAVVDPSFRVADFIRENDIGVVADAEEPGSVAQAIRDIRAVDTFKNDKPIRERYTRKRSAKRISCILDSMVNL